MADTFLKSEIRKKKLAKKRDKAAKKELKKDNNDKGKSLEDMLVYVDVNGKFTNLPPHLQALEAEAKAATKKTYLGVVTHINENGYGFIKEDETKAKVFFHNTSLVQPVKINDKVKFTKEESEQGFRALKVNIN